MTNFNAIDEITEIDDLRELARDMKAEIARLRFDAIGYKASYDDLIGKLSEFIPIRSTLDAMKSNEALAAHIRKALEQKP